ncbi:MAG: AbrB/MazE/SpoVT family DNA-binding domain-containing protein [Kiritimatiellae bacterium]|nr:AbrB/MazE/SpoVT family DNA-binding domain-containing protein [Kiritimatiellia bacterium]
MGSAMYTTISSKGQVTIPVEIRNMLRLNTGDRIDFVIFDKNRVELMPKKGSVGSLKGLVKWSGKPMTLKQMDEAIAGGVCR